MLLANRPGLSHPPAAPPPPLGASWLFSVSSSPHFTCPARSVDVGPSRAPSSLLSSLTSSRSRIQTTLRLSTRARDSTARVCDLRRIERGNAAVHIGLGRRTKRDVYRRTRERASRRVHSVKASDAKLKCLALRFSCFQIPHAGRPESERDK